MNEEKYTQEREKVRQGDGGKGDPRKGLVRSKGKAILCLLRKKKLLNEMILAARPTSKTYMPARASLRQCWGLLRALAVTKSAKQEGRYTLWFPLHTQAGCVTFLRIWYNSPTCLISSGHRGGLQTQAQRVKPIISCAGHTLYLILQQLWSYTGPYRESLYIEPSITARKLHASHSLHQAKSKHLLISDTLIQDTVQTELM